MAADLTVTRVPFTPLDEAVGSPRRWGEAWWTACDLALLHPYNNPLLPDPVQAIVDELGRREVEAFLYGSTRRLL